MTQEEKQLLLKDLCARLPFGVVLDNPNPCGGHWDELISIDMPNGTVTLLYDGRTYKVEKIKPYLRPMSSMTDEERRFLLKFGTVGMDENDKVFDVYPFGMERTMPVIDFLNAHHFDYRGLIEKGLALEATERMYKTE